MREQNHQSLMPSYQLFALLSIVCLASAQQSSPLNGLLEPLQGVEGDVKGAITALGSILNGTQMVPSGIKEELTHISNILIKVLETLQNILGIRLPIEPVEDLLTAARGDLEDIITELGNILASKESLPDGLEAILQKVLELLQHALEGLEGILENLTGGDGLIGGLMNKLTGPNGLLSALLGGANIPTPALQ